MRMSDWSSDVGSSDLDEIGAVATIDFPDSLRVVTECPEIFLDVVMFAEQEDRHLPDMAPDKFILIGFGDQSSHGLAEKDRKSVVSGKRVSVRVNLGGRRHI